MQPFTLACVPAKTTHTSTQKRTEKKPPSVTVADVFHIVASGVKSQSWHPDVIEMIFDFKSARMSIYF